MPERAYPMVTQEVRYECDVCHKGELRPTGRAQMYLTNPGQHEYEHACTNCGHFRTFPHTYPLVRHVLMDNG